MKSYKGSSPNATLWFTKATRFKPVTSLILFITQLNLCSCAVGPDFNPPAGPDTDSYILDKAPPKKTVGAKMSKSQKTKDRSELAQYFRPDLDIPSLWWEVFHSKELNELICTGLRRSPNIVAAKASLQQAQDNYYSNLGTLLLPLITGQASAQHERLSDAAFGGRRDVPNSPFSLYNAQINVTYVLDVFGGNRRKLEALAAQIQYQQFELEAAYLTLSTNIVTAAIQEASLRSQIVATKELIKISDNQLKIVRQQFKLGGVSKTEVLSQETSLATIKATLPSLQNSLDQTRHLLAILIGELPSEDCLPKFWFDNLKLPKNLPLTLPSNLICQRPDVRASLALMHQASANIGVATANMLPSVTLSGYYGWQSNTFNSLFTPHNLLWNYGAQVMQTIFQGGALYYARRSAIAALEQAAAQYHQTVLVAFQNVADSLRAIEHDAETFRDRVEVEKLAKETLKLAQIQFKLGAINYITLLNAEQQYQNAILNKIKAKANRFSDTAALFQALGGGWWNRDCYTEFLMVEEKS